MECSAFSLHDRIFRLAYVGLPKILVPKLPLLFQRENVCRGKNVLGIVFRDTKGEFVISDGETERLGVSFSLWRNRGEPGSRLGLSLNAVTRKVFDLKKIENSHRLCLDDLPVDARTSSNFSQRIINSNKVRVRAHCLKHAASPSVKRGGGVGGAESDARDGDGDGGDGGVVVIATNVDVSKTGGGGGGGGGGGNGRDGSGGGSDGGGRDAERRGAGCRTQQSACSPSAGVSWVAGYSDDRDERLSGVVEIGNSKIRDGGRNFMFLPCQGCTTLVSCCATTTTTTTTEDTVISGG
ncbi:hypothetical protein HZH68_000842 [Vespula germanica]|uniref:Uncharacterized protein n=1 Tax=Vespula germanica TaxID=30212 RepID=A0A834U652_VESGE|nr:hypothetical protein HZH68_000842 [Vespula germanica]